MIEPGSMYAQFLFDLRNDTGVYANRGNDPKIAAQNIRFDRAGTKFGIALTSTDPSFPPITLLVTETLLYGFAGSLHKLDLFETSLSYSLDPNNYFGIKVSYKNGRDEDTAARVQSWTAGLSARY
jgi:hypothetical protein